MADVNVIRGRKLSLEGAAQIGDGFFSTVYLIGEDTVVKVLKNGSFEDAAREILLSKWAFRKGIPTAISFDVADVDGHPGLVYESLGRGNIRNELRDRPENFDSILDRYAELLKTVNSVDVDEGQLPSALSEYREKLSELRPYFTVEEYSKLRELIDTIPDAHTLVHRDCQVKNVKVVGKELYLIDLDTLSVGDPIFELMALYSCYVLFPMVKNVDFDPFFELSTEMLNRVYHALTERYFAGLEKEALSENEDRIALLAYIHMLSFVKNNPDGFKNAIPLLKSKLNELMPKLSDLKLQYP